ncbi:MAG: gliding motility-associated C-terminal domain-containing protein [Bacteroidales bacterium]|nr:gliding motility-associated C-terminal domain-containing protein [Bacteroidales bacterium]
MNKLKDYKSQPDPQVWNRINRRLALRRLALPATIVTVVAAVVVVVLATNHKPASQPESQPVEVAAVLPAAEPQAVAEVRNEVQPTVAPATKAIQHKTDAADRAIVAPAAVSATQPAESDVATAKETQAQAPVASKAVAETNKAATQSVPKTEAATAAAQQSVAEPATTGLPETRSTKSANAKSAAKSLEDLVYVPNAFTPADPEHNRFFQVVTNIDTVGAIYDFRIVIYNRRGAQVYESNDINFRWNGTRAGQPLPQGAYVYMIRYRDTHGEQHLQKGTVTLIR